MLGARVVGGVVVHKAAREGALGPLALVRGAHPVPDERSRIAGSRVLQHARAVGPEARALVLISGGASSLVCAPRAPVTVQDLQSLTTSLLGAGADIHAINHIRRELDVIKGGGLARALARTRAHSLILADVDAARWEDVGSGPTAPRARDPAGAWATIERLRLASRVPPRVREALRVASPPGCPIEHPRTCVGAVEDAVAAARRVAARSGVPGGRRPGGPDRRGEGLAPALARTLDDWTRDGGARAAARCSAARPPSRCAVRAAADETRARARGRERARAAAGPPRPGAARGRVRDARHRRRGRADRRRGRRRHARHGPGDRRGGPRSSRGARAQRQLPGAGGRRRAAADRRDRDQRPRPRAAARALSQARRRRDRCLKRHVEWICRRVLWKRQVEGRAWPRAPVLPCAVAETRPRIRLPLVSGERELPRRTRTVSALAGDAPRPGIAVWELTLACDQRCLHCGPRAGKARARELDTARCLEVVAQLAAIGVSEVSLIGGEAYLRDDCPAIVRAIRAHGMTCILTTGGYNLTQARAEALAAAGVQSVSISIDGLQETHDRLRGRARSWARAFAAMRRLRALGVQVAVNTQINAWTKDELLPLLELVAAAGAHAWQVQITVAHGNAADHPELLLQPYMIPEVFETLERALARCRELGVLLYPGNSVGYFGPLEHPLRRPFDVEGHYRGCAAGRATLGIESDGRLKGCPSLDGAVNGAGSLAEHDLEDLWSSAPALRFFRARGRDSLWGYCARCYYADTCKAGCTTMTEPLFGRPGNNPFCHHRALELRAQGLRERVEQVRAATGRPFDSGLFQLVLERVSDGARVHVEPPRTSRALEPDGPGSPLPIAP
ncbi:MAG: DUF4147 domain-containing protein [Myxococcales bacterium]|nr:DUF4147 domain-containing protein [Myxococcales bacterium]